MGGSEKPPSTLWAKQLSDCEEEVNNIAAGDATIDDIVCCSNLIRSDHVRRGGGSDGMETLLRKFRLKNRPFPFHISKKNEP